VGRPRVEIIEECMREGMQIESADISVADKVRLLDALSETGLQTIVVASFVSPKWTPQMAEVDELIQRFRPVPGVRYTALALNEKGRERLAAHCPPLSPVAGPPRTLVHLCDVFVRRNTNRSQQDELDALPGTIRRAVDAGAHEAGIAVNAAWGSNWLGPFSESDRMELLEHQWRLWQDAGIPVTKVWLGDPMAWNLPHQVASQIRAIRARWPEIHTFHLHLHNARGSALTSAYAALEELDERHTLIIDSAVGGMGGCPYCGHGRMTRMIPTEDLVDLLEEMGIDTGVDLDRLIEVAHLAEEIVGHELWGHVSKAGARPRGDRLFAMDMPFIETVSQAQHFRLGPSVYEGAPSPWKQPITSPRRPV
jgi:hydroxymethylglutaryl-CoA lyase